MQARPAGGEPWRNTATTHADVALHPEALDRRTAVGHGFDSRVLRDEYFTFQVAVIAGNTPLDDVRVPFERFPETGRGRLTCFNYRRHRRERQPFTKKVKVEARAVQPLWIGVQIPRISRPDWSRARWSSRPATAQTIHLRLDVDDAAAMNHGSTSRS